MRWLPFELSEGMTRKYFGFSCRLADCTRGGIMWTFVQNVLRRRQGVSLYRIIFNYLRQECLLFTGQFGVKAREGNTEGLDSTHRISGNISIIIFLKVAGRKSLTCSPWWKYPRQLCRIAWLCTHYLNHELSGNSSPRPRKDKDKQYHNSLIKGLYFCICRGFF